jgi:putative hydrolase of the HAD superfamily
VIQAVLFDLDDTLYDQRDWLAGAWITVAAAAAPFGAATGPLWRGLLEIAAEGTDRGCIIDRALERAGATDVPIAPLLEAFRSHDPLHLAPFPGATEALGGLRDRCRVGLVTDGDPRIQRSKLRALGLLDAFDVVVFSDELGRERRKPHPAPFRAALSALRVAPERAVYVGDRPDKDVAGAHAAGMRAIRVLTGEYAEVPNGCVQPVATVRSVVEAIALCTRDAHKLASVTPAPPGPATS